jgi:8-oxo-dGTP diphosphatase
MTGEKFVVVVECMIEHAGKFLIIRRPEGVHAGGLLAFPGGKIDIEDGIDNQDILIEAMKREVLEEVGLTLIDPLRFVTSSYFLGSQQNTSVLGILFYCKLEKTHVEVIASSREVPEYFWLTRDEINLHPDTPEWVVRYLSKA